MPEPDTQVTVSRRDVYQAIYCGLFYDSRFGYGVPPKSLWDALTDEERELINDACREHYYDA